MQIWEGFRRTCAPGTDRGVIQLTSGKATCYPLYYFIDSISNDGRQLVYHRAEEGEVQLHVLDLVSGRSQQLTHATASETRWIPWCVESGSGVLDHRSVLDTISQSVIYFDGNRVRRVDLSGGNDRLMFTLPADRIPIGQNCITGNGKWFVYIHHDRELFSAGRTKSKGTTLAAYNLETEVHRALVHINSPIHHVLPLGGEQLVFCHPTMENGMLLTDIRGGWYTHMRTQDEDGGCVCHYVATSRGIAYEVLGRKDGRVLAGLYNPKSHNRYEFALPADFGYTHTGRDPEGRLWFYESCRPAPWVEPDESKHVHELRFLARHVAGGEDEWITLFGHWPTYGGGQKAHFHPQVTPDRKCLLITAGDPTNRTNHLFLVDIEDLNSTHGIPEVE